MSILSTIGGALGSIASGVGSVLPNKYLSAAVSGVGSALSGVSASADTKSMARDQMNFNASEAQKAREFNAQQAQLANEFSAKEAEKSRAWSEKMYNLQNEYNSPSAQLQRMSDAGINVNLLGNELVGSSDVPSGASASGVAASSPAASAALSPAPASVAASAAAQTQLAAAQARNLEANTKRTLGLSELDAALANGTIALQNSTIELQSAQRDLNKKELLQVDAQVRKIDTECDTLKESLELLRAQTQNVKLSNDEKVAYLKRINEIVDASIDKMLSDISVNKATAKLQLANVEQVKQQILNLITSEKGQEYTNNILYYEWKLRNKTFRTSVDLTNAANQSGKIGFDFRNNNINYATGLEAVGQTLGALGRILSPAAQVLRGPLSN